MENNSSENQEGASAVERLLNLDQEQGMTVESTNKRKNREKAADEWLNKYFAVDTFIAEGIANKSLDPATTTRATLKVALVNHWEAKEATNNEQVTQTISKRYAIPAS